MVLEKAPWQILTSNKFTESNRPTEQLKRYVETCKLRGRSDHAVVQKHDFFQNRASIFSNCGVASKNPITNCSRNQAFLFPLPSGESPTFKNAFFDLAAILLPIFEVLCFLHLDVDSVHILLFYL